MKPFPIVVNVLTKFENIIPKWKIVPTKNIIASAFKDRAKREEVRFGEICLVFDAQQNIHIEENKM